MKKILFVLVALLFAAPAWASVDITMAQVDDTNEVIISITSTEANLIRAYSLDIKLAANGGDPDPNILEVAVLNAGYWAFPGTIQIDASGNVTSLGSPVAEYGDLPQDTLAGLDSNGVTVELGSLYAPVGPGSPNAPAQNGALLSVKVSDSACITITANESRAGASGVVMEDPDESPTVNLPGTLCIEVITVPPTCWDNAGECGGQMLGDATCDGAVNLADLFALKAAWGAVPPWVAPKCCADFNQSGAVNLADLFVLKANWGKTGLLPATKNQVCP